MSRRSRPLGERAHAHGPGGQIAGFGSRPPGRGRLRRASAARAPCISECLRRPTVVRLWPARRGGPTQVDRTDSGPSGLQGVLVCRAQPCLTRKCRCIGCLRNARDVARVAGNIVCMSLCACFSWGHGVELSLILHHWVLAHAGRDGEARRRQGMDSS